MIWPDPRPADERSPAHRAVRHRKFRLPEQDYWVRRSWAVVLDLAAATTDAIASRLATTRTRPRRPPPLSVAHGAAVPKEASTSIGHMGAGRSPTYSIRRFAARGRQGGGLVARTTSDSDTVGPCLRTRRRCRAPGSGPRSSSGAPSTPSGRTGPAQCRGDRRATGAARVVLGRRRLRRRPPRGGVPRRIRRRRGSGPGRKPPSGAPPRQPGHRREEARIGTGGSRRLRRSAAGPGRETGRTIRPPGERRLGRGCTIMSERSASAAGLRVNNADPTRRQCDNKPQSLLEDPLRGHSVLLSLVADEAHGAFDMNNTISFELRTHAKPMVGLQ